MDKKRMYQAAKIISKADSYKICEGCDSIVTIATKICPNCHAYRFDEDPERVISQAKTLATRDQQSVTKEDLF